MKRFRMREAPKKPTKRTIAQEFPIYDTTGMGEVVAWATKLGVRIEDVTLSFDHVWDSVECAFQVRIPEPEIEYEVRLAKYKKELKEYNAWLTEHQKEIQELKEKKKQKEAEEKAKTKIRLQQQVQELQKKLNKLD